MKKLISLFLAIAVNSYAQTYTYMAQESTDTKTGALYLMQNVGIGTTNTNRKLHVRGNTQIGYDTEDFPLTVSYAQGSVGAITGIPGYTQVLLDNNASNALAIVSKADSISSVVFGDKDNAVQGRIDYDNSTDAMTFRVNASYSPLYLGNNGNVGIGTTNPSYELQVEDTDSHSYLSVISSSGYTAGLLFGDEYSAGRGQISYYNPTDLMDFYTAGVFRMRVDGNGNVGIGTQSPSWKLDVQTSVADWTARFYNTDTTNAHGLYVRAGGSGANKVSFLVENTAGDDRFKVMANGNVGIGTIIPLNKFDLNHSSITMRTPNGTTVSCGPADGTYIWTCAP